ncbi:hypothetical protein F5Y16DRAFT_397742 [Xylariaceae sp. FL0255]|nr:hypothetical protein F5Y16DRAFT_397742 [Xylariaceae sp. FL0255]
MVVSRPPSPFTVHGQLRNPEGTDSSKGQAPRKGDFEEEDYSEEENNTGRKKYSGGQNYPVDKYEQPLELHRNGHRKNRPCEMVIDQTRQERLVQTMEDDGDLLFEVRDVNGHLLCWYPFHRKTVLDELKEQQPPIVIGIEPTEIEEGLFIGTNWDVCRRNVHKHCITDIITISAHPDDIIFHSFGGSNQPVMAPGCTQEPPMPPQPQDPVTKHKIVLSDDCTTDEFLNATNQFALTIQQACDRAGHLGINPRFLVSCTIGDSRAVGLVAAFKMKDRAAYMDTKRLWTPEQALAAGLGLPGLPQLSEIPSAPINAPGLQFEQPNDPDPANLEQPADINAAIQSLYEQAIPFDQAPLN